MAFNDPLFDSAGRPLATPASLLAQAPPAVRAPVSPAAYITPTEMYQDADQAPVDTSTTFYRGLRRSVGEIGPAARSVYGAGQVALGNTDAGINNLRRAQADISASEARDPSHTISDVHSAGDVGSYLADKAGSFLPDAAMMLAPGGVIGKFAEGGAAAVGRRALAKLATDGAAGFAEREAGVAASTATAKAAGTAVGTAAGAYPGAVAGSNQDVLDAKTPEEAQVAAQKGLAGAVPQAALAAVVPSRFLSKLAGPEVGAAASDAVAKTAERFLPAVTKSVAKEGVAMAGLNVAQTATALATHSWMTDHLDVLPPGAFNQYLDAAVSGAIFGGVFGAAGHVAEHGVGADTSALRAQASERMQASVNAVREKVRSALGDTQEEADAAAKAKTSPDAAPAAGNEPAADEPSAADMYRAHFDRLADRADQDLEGDHRLDAIEQRHNAFMQSGESLGGDAPRYTNPVKMDSPLQNTLMSFVPRDSALWLHDATAKDVARSAEKMFTGGELDDTDAKHIAALASVVGHDTVEHWAAVGPEFAKLTDLTKKAQAESPDPVKLTEQERNTQNVQTLQTKLDGMAPDHPERPATQALLGEAYSRASETALDAHEAPRANAADAGDTALHEQGAGDEKTLAQRVVEAAPGTPEHADAQSQLRDALIGHRDTDPARPYREMRAGDGKNNVIVGNNEAQIAKTLKRGFEIESDHPGKPLIVDIQNLVKKKLGGADGERMAGDAFGALTETMGDLALAGVKVKPESIKTGVEYAPGAKLTPAQARMLRASHDNVKAFQERAAEKASAASSPLREKEDAARTRRADKVEPLAKRKAVIEHEEPDTQLGDQQDNRIDDGRLLERRSPPESPAPDSREKPTVVQQAGGIADVKHTGPHDRTLADAREKLVNARTPAARAAVRHEAGVKVGQAELDRQRDAGQISSARYARETKALNNPDSGKSRDYLAKAAKGDFDHFKVEESRGENAAPKEDPRRVASEESTPAKGASDPEHAARRYDEDINVGFKEAGKEDGPHDHGKETAALNGVLKELGVKSQITVKALPKADRANKAGFYQPGSKTIYINPNLHGAKRMEVLTHELGHHIIREELGAKLEKATPELRAALEDDYAKWRAEQHAKGGDAAVSEVLASRKPYFRAGAIEEGSSGITVDQLKAKDPTKHSYLFDDEEYFADQISRALTQSDRAQGVIGKFFSDIAEFLKRAYDTLARGGDERYKPAPSVEKWVQSLFDRNTRDVSDALAESVPKKTADAGVEAAVHMHSDAEHTGSVLDEPGFKPFKAFVEERLSPDERGILERALYRRTIMKQITAHFGDDERLQNALENPAEEMGALMYVADKMMQEGKLKFGPQSTDVMLGLRTQLFKIMGVAGNNDHALKLFADIRSGELERIKDAGNKYDVRERSTGRNPAVQRIFNDAHAIHRDHVYQPWRRLMYGTGSNAHLSYTPALREVHSLFKLGTGAVGERHGLTQDVARQRQLFNVQAGKALGHLDKDQLAQVSQHLREQTAATDPVIAKAVGDVHQLFADARDYAVKAGVPIKDRGPNYHPVVMDPAEVMKRKGDFEKLLSQPHFADAIKDQGLTVDKLVEMAQRTQGEHGEGAVNPLAPPDMRAMNPRVMQFIYDHGTAEDKKAFAGFQQKDLDMAITPYMHSLVNRAEFARRAGDKGEKLNALFDKAAKQNANAKDVEYTKSAIAAMTGAYGADGSPLVRSIFGDKAAKWVTSAPVKSFTDGLLAYQNVRTLSLSLLSALADPMGIGVRYGGIKSLGDLRQAWKSFSAGMSAIAKRSSSADLRDQASIIGMADDYMTSQILSEGYAPGLGGLGRKVSDAMFKYNGLTKFVQGTRYMALSAANAFLLKHAAGRDPKHSTRYLRELGVTADDISTGKNGMVKLLTNDEVKTAAPEEAARDERVKRALNRFVDEAILRTDPSQAPLYFNDPAMRLVTQYQQFLHAFDTQILERVAHEFNYSNYGSIAPLLGYVPITIAAEMTRGLIQYGPGGNPQRADWGPLDWSAFGGERAGVFGPRMQQGLGLLEGKQYAAMQSSPFGIEVGPTVSQAGEVAKTIAGSYSPAKTLTDALPASNVFKHW